MAMRSKWEKKEPIEWSEWSLIPSLPVCQTWVYGVQLAWALFSLSAVIVNPQQKLSCLLNWAVGAWVLRYVLLRCRRLPADLTAFVKVNEDSTFQVRLF